MLYVKIVIFSAIVIFIGYVIYMSYKDKGSNTEPYASNPQVPVKSAAQLQEQYAQEDAKKKP